MFWNGGRSLGGGGPLVSDGRACRIGGIVVAAAAASGALLSAASPRAEAAAAPELLRDSSPKRELRAISTGRRPELRKTIPVARKREQGARVVMSLGPAKLPRLRVGDRLRVSAEVTATTTCVTRSARCIGRRYGFSPHVGARLYLADRAKAGRRRSLPLSRRISLICGQRRPNRNHHCPLVIESAGMRVDQLRDLPCRPTRCHLNLVLDAHHRKARGGEVIVVGADRPEGGVSQGKGRLDAVLIRKEARLGVADRRSTKRRIRRLPIGFTGGHRVLYSQRLGDLRAGDVLRVRARQRTAIRRLPYFVGSRIVVSTRADGVRPTPFVRRLVSGSGWVTQPNGFNCTPGPSAFRSPCLSRKVGMVRISRTPRKLERRRLFVNLISRTFPKLAQGGSRSAGSAHPRPRILPGGSISVERLRAR